MQDGWDSCPCILYECICICLCICTFSLSSVIQVCLKKKSYASPPCSSASSRRRLLPARPPGGHLAPPPRADAAFCQLDLQETKNLLDLQIRGQERDTCRARRYLRDYDSNHPAPPSRLHRAQASQPASRAPMSPPHTVPAPPPACNLGLKNLLTSNTRSCSRRRQQHRRGAKPNKERTEEDVSGGTADDAG